MSEWCQNKKCPQKKTSGQIRGSKGAKYYQSNRLGSYTYGGGNFCTLQCHNEWSEQYISQAIDTLGIRIYEPVKINLDDAWFVEYKYSNHRWDSEREESVEVTPAGYYLINKLKGIKRAIPRQQAQTPEDIAEDRTWSTIDDTQAKELAIQLGLAS